MKSIECRSLTFNTKGWQANYTCTFRTGEWHVVCGGSGSGKSTLLNLVLGIQQPTSGSLLVDSKNIVDVPPHLRMMSYMSQVNTLFSTATIMDNLMLALHDSPLTKNESIAKISSLVDHLKIPRSLLSRLPSGLSGGELSRCNLARALLRPCSWLLLDEPFAAVDRPTRLSILSWLKQWQIDSGAGVVLVSHDLDDIFTVASHITVVEKGHIVENAPVTAAIETPSHTATAKLLRAGIVCELSGRQYFVSSKHLHSSRSTLTCSDQFAGLQTLTAPHVTVIGNTCRIIDLATGVDVLLVYQDSVPNALWFDLRLATELRG